MRAARQRLLLFLLASIPLLEPSRSLRLLLVLAIFYQPHDRSRRPKSHRLVDVRVGCGGDPSVTDRLLSHLQIAGFLVKNCAERMPEDMELMTALEVTQEVDAHNVRYHMRNLDGGFFIDEFIVGEEDGPERRLGSREEIHSHGIGIPLKTAKGLLLAIKDHQHGHRLNEEHREFK